MADSFRPRITRASRSTAIYKVRFPESGNSNSNALGVNYPLFFLGAVIISVIIFYLRSVPHSKVVVGSGLIAYPNPLNSVYAIENTTARVEKQATGEYLPVSSPDATSGNSVTALKTPH